MKWKEVRSSLSFQFVALAALALSARADTITLHPTHDTTLYENPLGNSANGAGSAMFAGRNSAATNSIRRALLRFDFSAVPAGAMLTAVSLRLLNSAANADAAVVSMHRMSQSWGEGPSIASGGQGNGAPALNGDATWTNRFFPAAPWSSPGGDFAANPSASTTVIAPGLYEWSSIDLLADALAFHADPASNFGWSLLGDETVPSSAKRFATREDSNPANRPTLTVDFTVPEPSGAALIAFAFLTVATRRRVSR